MKRTSLWSKFLVPVCCLLILVYAIPALAAVTPADRWQAANLGTPSTGVYAWNSSIAYYNGQILYVATDKKIYAYNPNTSVSTEVCDTSALGPVYAAVSGLLVTSDNHLYFHDNQDPTVNLYRIDLTAAWPVAAPAAWDTGCSGSIFTLTENPWTNAVWFASADSGAGAGNMYLYEIVTWNVTATQQNTFGKQHPDSGNGPIIFIGTTDLLYGESTWAGDGYFHLVSSAGGGITTADYLTFTGGLAGAWYGPGDVVYAANGGGKKIYNILGQTKTEVGSTSQDAQSLAYSGNTLYVSEMNLATGAINFNSLWRKNIAYDIQKLAGPTPAPLSWNSSIAYYNGLILYVGDDKKIYAYNPTTGVSTEVCDTSGLGGGWGSAAGFLVTSGNMLYFHDNGDTTNLYRIDLTDPWPVGLGGADWDTLCDGSIYALAENPWTGVVWFASADFAPGANMYLYEVNWSVAATKQSTIAKKDNNNSGNGPIVFKGVDVVLYGESVWGGDGYFHLVNSTTGAVVTADLLTFTSGLAGAAHAFDQIVFAGSGAGKKIYRLQAAIATAVATTVNNAQVIAFGNGAFYFSQMDGAGAVSLYRFKIPGGDNPNPPAPTPAGGGGGGGGGGGCFLETTSD